MYCFKPSSDTILAQFATIDVKICFAMYKAAFHRLRMPFRGLAFWTGLCSSCCRVEVYLDIPTLALTFTKHKERLIGSGQAVWKQVGLKALHSVVPSTSPHPQLTHHSSTINVIKTVKKLLWAPC